jgi:phosphoesterase RecJ-like protein
MIETLTEIRRLLDDTDRILIVSHVSPDGDTLGSALGLAWALRQWNKDVRLACADPTPPELRFLPGSEAFAAQAVSDAQVVLCIDASDTARLGSIYDTLAFQAVPVINIDHHVTNTLYGTVNLIVARSSTAEIIIEVIAHLGLPLERTAATCLLAGLVSDTRGFRTSNTTSESLHAASVLVEAGASLFDVSDAVFNHRSLATMQLWGAVLAEAQIENGLLWAELPLTLAMAHGGDPLASKGLINVLSECAEARVTVLFRELEDGAGVDVGLRSKPDYDVSAIALALGGGGHPQAAGCQLAGPLHQVEVQVLAALRALLAGE